MTSLSDVPLGAWASIGHPRQFDAPLDNEPPYDRFEMFSFDELRTDSDPMDRSHETNDATSIRSGSTSRLRQHNDENVAKKRFLSLRIRRLYSKWRRTHGYRFGVLFCGGLSGTVALTNLILTIWGSKSFGVDVGIGTIQHEQCDRTKSLSLWLHLAINVLGTALLSASNYIMQCLSSPTRSDIDKAHARNTWLDIGVPSVRNLSRITRKRTAFWWLLAITSLPLHLMYNSAVFETLSTHDYQVYTVSKDFLSGAPFESQDSDDFSPEEFTQQLNSLRDPNSGIRLRNTTTKECISTYSDAFANSKYKHVLAVSSLNDATNSFLDFVYSGRPDLRQQQNLWFCEDYEDYRGYCNVAEAVDNAQTLTVAEYPIDYCLVQEVDEECMLQFSLPIMFIVIICNLIKTACMIWVAFEGGPRPLVTVGDAIASFLKEPDPTTKNICLADKDFFRLRKGGWQATSLTWRPKRHRWYRAASMKRWLVCNVLCIIMLILTAVFLGKGLKNPNLTDKSISHLWKLGFGAVSSESLIKIISMPKGQGGIIASVLLANTPQALLSFLFLTYNGLLSSMLLMEEWTGFANERKALRVSWPTGMQRSSYWLQLPYKYGVPLLIVSGVLHWLVSQSLFLAHLIRLDDFLPVDPFFDVISTCGYSLIAMIFVIVLGSIILLLGISAGSNKYKSGMPLVGSCSAAISAACHSPKKDPNASLLPLMWGAVKTEEGSAKHCCFSSLEVSPPVEGEVYAGVEEIMNSDPPQDNTTQLIQRVPRSWE